MYLLLLLLNICTLNTVLSRFLLITGFIIGVESATVNYFVSVCFVGFPGGANGKEPSCKGRRYKRHGFDPWVGKIPWRRQWQSTPVFLPGESDRQRSLAGYGP